MQLTCFQATASAIAMCALGRSPTTFARCSALRLDLDQPQDHVAVVLAGVRIALKSRLDEDEALGRPDDRRATEARHRSASSRWRFRRRR
jgi:hypothetical protein